MEEESLLRIKQRMRRFRLEFQHLKLFNISQDILVFWDSDETESNNNNTIVTMDGVASSSTISNYGVVFIPPKDSDLKMGDVLMLRHQYKQEENKIQFGNEQFYPIPTEAIVAKIKDSEIVSVYNGYSMVELEDKSKIKGVIRHSYSPNLVGQKVLVKTTVRTESDLFKKFNLVRVDDSDIINIIKQ